MDSLTYLPKIVWSDVVGASWLPTLGDLDTKRAVAWFIPMALVIAILLIFLFLMPVVVLAVAFVYLVSMWLRRSGMVFGSEKLSWNLANHISVTRHPNENTALRLFFISPEAWWRREVAHCYYYRSGRVIGDVADHIADWSRHKPTPAWPIEAWFAASARVLVVLLFLFSIFAVSVPIAAGLASVGPILKAMLFNQGLDEVDSGSLPEPKDASGYATRAVAYRAKRHFDRAIADHTKAIELEPNNAILYNDRGNDYVAKGDPDQAIADFTKAIELDPKIALPLNNRGGVYRTKGDNDKALADFTKAIELAPDYADAFSNRGNIYYAKGDIDLAIVDYTKAIELAPSNFGFVVSLGVAKYGKGDFKDAAADLGRSIEMRAYIYAMLFRYLARTRAGETAAAELEANVGRLETKQWPYAVAELYLGKRTPATMLDAAKKPNERCEAEFYLGQWHILKSNVAEAANALKVAVESCPKTFYEYLAAIAELNRLKR
jgi:lipoprotein NlpI